MFIGTFKPTSVFAHIFSFCLFFFLLFINLSGGANLKKLNSTTTYNHDLEVLKKVSLTLFFQKIPY